MVLTVCEEICLLNTSAGAEFRGIFRLLCKYIGEKKDQLKLIVYI